MAKKPRKKPCGAKGESKVPIVQKAVKGAIYGLIITVLSVLLFALIVKQAALGDEVIAAVNQVIKVVSVFVAALIATKSLASRNIWAGCLAGGVYVLLGFLMFSLIEGTWGDGMLLLADFAMGLVVGMLTAIIFGKLLAPRQEPKRAAVTHN